MANVRNESGHNQVWFDELSHINAAEVRFQSIMTCLLRRLGDLERKVQWAETNKRTSTPLTLLEGKFMIEEMKGEISGLLGSYDVMHEFSKHLVFRNKMLNGFAGHYYMKALGTPEGLKQEVELLKNQRVANG